MTSHRHPVPDMVPVLSRGKHRSPRKGACFMELASYLAGERWSDHPSCTHPLLATLARLVNDHTTDAGRNDLGRLVPSVIGIVGDDPHIDVRITLRAATAALPVAASERQRVLAVSLLTAERLLSDLDGRPDGSLTEASRGALAQAPDAERWARSFTREIRTGLKGFRRYAAPNTIRQAVVGIAQACIPDPDPRLRDLLAGAIADCEELVLPRPGATEVPAAAGFELDAESWEAACALTGAPPRSH